MAPSFDLIVIGTGMTGNGTAHRCRQAGWRVAVVDDEPYDGTRRIGIEEMNELEDAVSADILTGICRGIDKWLWFVEAHAQDDRGTEPD